MGEGLNQSPERVLGLALETVYVLTYHDLYKTTELSPEDLLADYGGRRLSGQIEWFRIFKVNKQTQELEILYSWGDLGRYYLTAGQRFKLDRPEQWCMQWRGNFGNYQSHGETYYKSEHHMFLAWFSLYESNKNTQIISWIASEKETRNTLGRKSVTRNYLICRVNGMRAFFE